MNFYQGWETFNFSAAFLTEKCNTLLRSQHIHRKLVTKLMYVCMYEINMLLVWVSILTYCIIGHVVTWHLYSLSFVSDKYVTWTSPMKRFTCQPAVGYRNKYAVLWGKVFFGQGKSQYEYISQTANTLPTDAGLTSDPSYVIPWGSRRKQNGD